MFLQTYGHDPAVFSSPNNISTHLITADGTSELLAKIEEPYSLPSSFYLMTEESRAASAASLIRCQFYPCQTQLYLSPQHHAC